MKLTAVTELGQTFTLEIDPDLSLENVMLLLESESGIPQAEQSISYETRELSNPQATMRQLGVSDASAVIILRRKVPNPALGAGPVPQDAEMVRLQLLGDPNLLRQVQQAQPELAHAAAHNPSRFSELWRQTSQRIAEEREFANLNADPYDIEAQRRIEESIRNDAVMENMAHALEYSPESFGRVHMLYIPVEVNGHPVKAFVDSGAQQTIMSPDCAEACSVMRLLDTRFSGIARGVGTAKILGRIHSTQLRVADLFLPCSITVMEGKDVDLLLGLDMLKAHQACIDLEKGVLRVQGREVAFLAEHELPDKARVSVEGPSESSGSTVPGSINNPQAAPRLFPGPGNTLGSSGPVSSSSSSTVSAPTSTPDPPASSFPEASIQVLLDLGAPSREIAIRTLEAAGGNVDVAASLLF